MEEPPDRDVELPPFAPAAANLPRLTASQYRRTVASVFGEPLPFVELEADTNPHLFYSVGATRTTISERGVDLYEQAATETVRAVFADVARRDALIGCSVTADGCVRDAIERVGRRLFRRPLTTEEVERWVGVSAIGTDPNRGLEYALSGMLQAPSFLYRAELGAPDPDAPELRRLDGYEVAARLSFLFLDQGPDDTLLDLAAAGAFDDETGIDEAARRLLDDPRAERTVGAFFTQYLDLGRLEGLERDAAVYPTWTETLAPAMRTEIELLVHDLVFRREADVRELFFTRRTFVNDELARFYGVAAPGAGPIAFVPVELPAEGPRAGLLSLAGPLAMNAHASETSPTLRGKYVRERVLCESVPAPPDDVDLVIPEPAEGDPPATLRERLEQHRADARCAACHAYIDPPGMLFQHFDSIGAYRETENGLEIDATGDLDGTFLADARDLAEALRTDERVPRCIVRQLYRHATGRLEQPSEARPLAALEDAFAASGYRFTELMIELARSEVFRVTTLEGEE